MSVTWTDEMVEILKQMRDQNKTSGQIGAVLGVSDGAVSGKIRRLGLPRLPRNVDGMTLKRQDRASPERLPPRVFVGDAAFAPIRGYEPVPFGSPGCKWPVGGSGADTLCCGAERVDGRPYCVDHCALGVAAHTPKLKVPKNADSRVRRIAA